MHAYIRQSSFATSAFSPDRAFHVAYVELTSIGAARMTILRIGADPHSLVLA